MRQKRNRRSAFRRTPGSVVAGFLIASLSLCTAAQGVEWETIYGSDDEDEQPRLAVTDSGDVYSVARVSGEIDGMSPPIPGDFWLVNFCRVRPPIAELGKEYSCLSATFGNFFEPRFFAGLIFK